MDTHASKVELTVSELAKVVFAITASIGKRSLSLGEVRTLFAEGFDYFYAINLISPTQRELQVLCDMTGLWGELKRMARAEEGTPISLTIPDDCILSPDDQSALEFASNLHFACALSIRLKFMTLPL